MEAFPRDSKKTYFIENFLHVKLVDTVVDSDNSFANGKVLPETDLSRKGKMVEAFPKNIEKENGMTALQK